MKVIARIIKSAAFWMGAAALLLIAGRELVFTSCQWQNVLIFANFPLAAFLFTVFPSVISPGMVGGVYTSWEMFSWYLPYYTLFFLTYLGYGALLDVIFRRFRRKLARLRSKPEGGNAL